MFCVWFLTRDHPIVSMLPSELSAGHAFLHLLLDSGPALLVGFIATAAIGFLGSERAARWLARGNAFTQTAKAICVAPFLPFCSCGVLPVYRTLILTGAAPTAAIAFLVATPELNVTALAYSSTLLGWKVTLLRIALALVAACLVGLVVARILPKTAVAALPQAAAVAPPTSLRVRTRSALEFGFVESVQHVMPFVLLGLFVAALCEPFLDPASIARMPAGLDVAVLTVIGIPAYVCASGATPLAAVLIHKGISVGAVLAFMLTGPASNVTTVGMLARLHGKKTALGFVLGMCVVAIGAGFAVNLFVPNPTTAWSMHGNEERESSLVAWLSVAVLAALTTHVLLREGLAGFLAALRSPGAHPVHAHGSCADPTCADHPSPLAPPAVISPLVLDSVFASGSITVKKLQVQPRRAYVSTPPK
jgi:hypothetical protein